MGVVSIGTVIKNPPANARDAREAGSIPESGRSPGVGSGNPLQYYCLGKSHGQWSLAGCSSWGHKKSDTTGHTRVQLVSKAMGLDEIPREVNVARRR